MNKYFLLFIFGLSFNVYADIPIKSVRSIFQVKGEMYISSGRENNHSKNYKQLNQLWEKKDKISFIDNYEKWKEITVDEISFNDGAEAKHFILFKRNEVSSVYVKKAYLHQWGCDGSIVPVLNLGKSPLKSHLYDWEGITIEIPEKYGLPIIVPSNKDILSLIPEKDKKDIIDDDRYPLIELKWEKLPSLRVIVAEFDTYIGTTAKEIIIINKVTGEVNIIKRKSPFDGRC